MSVTYFGASVLRKEDAALLRGKGKYVDDVKLPGMLHAAFVRSSVAHARICGFDKQAALALPGVHAVITHDDLPEPMRSLVPPRGGTTSRLLCSLVERLVRYRISRQD